MRRFIPTIRIAARRLIPTRAAILALALLAFPAPAGAQFFGIDLSPAGLISGAFRVIANILSFLIGIAYMIVSFLVQFMLTLNYDILTSNNAVVDVGWRIVRDVANLGFVIVIIAVAVATMLRLESYGAKKLLVRLIMAAIIVNFSLAIAGVVIDFSHVITRFFLEDGLGASNAMQLMDSVGGAFNPQRFMLETPDPAPPDPSEQTDFFTTFSTAVLVGLAGLGFSIIFMLIATLVVGALALMLLIRYVALSFLLVLAPLAWLFWVIPALQGQFHKWWSKFLEWTFFAPAVSFFIYLAIAAAKALGEKPLAAIPGLDGVLETIISQGAQMVVLSGIMIGGLIVAQNMGIAGAKGAMGLATRAQKGAQAWAGRQGKRMGARTLETTPMKSLAGAMQRIPGLKRAGMALGGQADIMRRDIVKDADKRLAKYGDGHLAKNLDTLSQPERVAALERLAKNDTMGLIKDHNGNGDTLGTINSENEKAFKRFYGDAASPKWKAVEIGAGMNVAAADAVRRNDFDGPNGVREEMKKWIKGLKPEQIAKLPVNDIFNGEVELTKIGFPPGKQVAEDFRTAFINGIAQNIPSDIAKLFKSVKSAGFEDMHSTVTRVRGDIKSTDPDRAQKILDALTRIASVRLYGGGDGATPAAMPTPPPAGPPVA